MDATRKANWCDKIDKMIYWGLLLIALSSCNSEPLARNAVRIVFILTGIRLMLDYSIIYRLKNYRGMAIAFGVYVLMLFMGAGYSGRFLWEISQHAFFFHYNILLIFIAGMFIRTKKQIAFLIGSLIISIFILDLRMIYKGLPHILAGKFIRINGVEKSSYFTQTAMFYCIMIPVMMVSLFRETGISCKERIFIVITLFLSGVAFLLTGVRGAWLGAVVAAVCCMLRFIKNYRIILALIISGCVFGGAVYCYMPQIAKRVTTITAKVNVSRDVRFCFFKSAVNMWKDHPVTGVGMNNYHDEYYARYILPEAAKHDPKEIYTHCHNNFLQFLAEEGIIGFGVFSGLTAYLLWFGWKNRKKDYGMIILLAIISCTVFGMSDYTYTDHQSWRLFYLLLGLCMAGLEIDY